MGGDIFTEEGRLTEAFSFYYARLVACSSEDERFVARWAQAEAERAERILTSDKDNLERIARTYISEISKTAEVGPTATRPGSRFNQKSSRQIQDGLLWKIGLSDYIEICPKNYRLKVAIIELQSRKRASDFIQRTTIFFFC